MNSHPPRTSVASRTYSLSEAAAQLGVNPKTLNRRMREHGIKPTHDHKDRRMKCITHGDLVTLAQVRKPKIYELASDVQNAAHTEQMRPLSESPKTHQPGNASARIPKEITELARMAIDLVDSAPSLLFPTADEIVVTFQGEADLFELATDSIRRSWHRALREATWRGWKIVHLIRQSPDQERTMRVVESLIRMHGISAGLYSPRYYSDSDDTVPASDFVVVPHRGILELTRPPSDRYVDHAELHKSGNRFDELLQHVRHVRDQCLPLTRPFHALSVEFSSAITDVDAHQSDRYLILNGLSDLTVPVELHRARERYLLDTFVDDVALKRQVTAITANRVLREQNFKRLVHHHRFRDMCPKRAIRSYVQSGEYAPDDWFHTMGCEPFGPDDIRSHLEHLIDRLRTYDNYELGLIEDEPIIDAFEYRTFRLVKSGHAVLLECEAATAEGVREEVDLQITEQEVVNGFFQHAENLWHDLGASNTDKRKVIEFLQKRLKELPPPGASRPEVR